jgi:CSLREA domain-containing protein
MPLMEEASQSLRSRVRPREFQTDEKHLLFVEHLIYRKSSFLHKRHREKQGDIQLELRLLSLLFLLMLLFSAFAASDSYATTITVTTTADTNDGVCDVHCSLREAVLSAGTGDTVVFCYLFI